MNIVRNTCLLTYTEEKNQEHKNGPPEHCHIHTISLLHPPPHPTFQRLEKLGGLIGGRIKKCYKFLKCDFMIMFINKNSSFKLYLH